MHKDDAIREFQGYMGIIVNYAAKRLGELMQVDSGTPQLTYVLSERSYYGKSTLALSKMALLDPSDMTLGHEVTHYLHGIIQPQLREAYAIDMDASNLVELVAIYGGDIYSDLDRKQVRGAKEEIKKLFNELTTSDFSQATDLTTGNLDYEVHEGGRRAAEHIYRVYGPEHFSAFSHATVAEAQSLLKDLGYEHPLHVVYKKSDEYETTNRNGCKRINMVINDIDLDEILKEVDERYFNDGNALSIHVALPSENIKLLK